MFVCARAALMALVGVGLLAGAGSCIDIPSVAAPNPTPKTSIAFLQAQGTNPGAGSSAQIDFTNEIAAHSAIVVCFIYDSTLAGAAPPRVEDTLGNTYKLVVGPARGEGTLYVALASDSAPGRNSVTVTLADRDSAKSYFELYGHEYAGIARSSAFEDGEYTTGTTSAKDGMTSGPIKTTSDGDHLLFGCSQAPGYASSGTGFTLRSSFDGNVTEDLVVNGQGTHTVTATMVDDAGSGFRWTMIGISLRGE